MNAGHLGVRSRRTRAAAGGKATNPLPSLSPAAASTWQRAAAPFTPTASNVTDIAARLSDLSHGQLTHRHCSSQRPPKPTLLLSGSRAHRPGLLQPNAIATDTLHQLALTLNTVTGRWELTLARTHTHTPRSARPDLPSSSPATTRPEEPGPASRTRSRSQQTTDQRRPR